MRLLLVLAWLLSLAGCASLPSASLEAQGLDFSKTELSGLRLAAVLPAGVMVRPGTARLAVLSRSGFNTLRTTFRLEPVSVGEGRHPAPPSVGGVMHVFRLADSERQRAEEFRREVIQRMTGQPHVELGVSADLCTNSESSARPIISIFLKSPEIENFVPLDKDRDIAALLPDGRLPACKAGVVYRENKEREG